MSPRTSMSEVPADHQGLGRAVPSFLRTKCAIKPVLCLLFSSPGDVALSVSLGGPRVTCGAVPVLPRPAHHLFSGPGPAPELTWRRSHSGAGTWPGVLFSDKNHPVFTIGPLVLSSHCLMSTQA